MEAFARAANGGQWEEMAVAARDLPAGEHFAQVGVEKRPGESLQPWADRGASSFVAGHEALLQRAKAREQVARGNAKGDEVARAVEAIPEILERVGVAARLEVGHEDRRRWPHRGQHGLEGAAEEIDAAVGQAGTEGSDDLAGARARIAGGEPDPRRALP